MADLALDVGEEVEETVISRTSTAPLSEIPRPVALSIEIGDDPEPIACFFEALAMQIRLRAGRPATLVVRLDS